MDEARSEDDEYVFQIDPGLPDRVTAIDGQYTETVSLIKARLLLWNLENGLRDGALGLDVERTQARPWPQVAHSSTKRQDLTADCNKLLRMCDDGDQDTFSYTVGYSYKYAQLGREYAIGGGNATLQSLSGTVRKTVCEGLCWDIDFVNCFNVILLGAARHWEWPDEIVDLLVEIVDDRATVHKELIGYYGCSEGAAKVLIIKHWGGGKAKAWLRDKKNKISNDVKAKVSDEGHHRIVKELERIAPTVLQLFLDKFPEMKAMLVDVNNQRIRDRREPKNEYTALHYGLQTVESKLLGHLEAFLVEQHEYRVDSKQYDGLYVHRGDETDGEFPLGTLRDAEAYMAAQDLGGGLKVPMKLKEKSVRCPYALQPIQHNPVDALMRQIGM